VPGDDGAWLGAAGLVPGDDGARLVEGVGEGSSTRGAVDAGAVAPRAVEGVGERSTTRGALDSARALDALDSARALDALDSARALDVGSTTRGAADAASLGSLTLEGSGRGVAGVAGASGSARGSTRGGAPEGRPSGRATVNDEGRFGSGPTRSSAGAPRWSPTDSSSGGRVDW